MQNTKQQILIMLEKITNEKALQKIFRIVHFYFIKDL